MVSGVLQDRHHELCIVRSANTPLILSKCVPEYCSCSIRNEEVKKGAETYWEMSVSVCQPVPQFLLPVVDKVAVT